MIAPGLKATTTILDANMESAKYPIQQNGEVDLVKLDKSVDWDSPKAVECLMFTVGFPEYDILIQEVNSDPGLAKLKWGGGRTLLHVAACDCQLELAELLIQQDADINANDRWSTTPLDEAADSGCAEIVKLLLDHGVPVDGNEDGPTPLYAAARRGHAEVVNVLLKEGADVTIQEENGENPLDIAVSRRHAEIVTMLLDQGAVSERAETNREIRRLQRDGSW